MMPAAKTSSQHCPPTSLANCLAGRHGRPGFAQAAALGLAAACAFTGLARADDFDARRARDLAAVVTSNGASGDLKQGEDGKPTLSAQAARIYFDVYFDDCDATKQLCNTVIFSGSWDTTKVTVDQVNRWNSWTLFCPSYLDARGKPNIWYGVAVSQHTARDDVASDVERWMGCLQDFDEFVADPDGFLKRNASEAPASPAAASAPAAASPAPSSPTNPTAAH